MALAKGINSYVSLSEADAFFIDRLDVAAWSEAPETQKLQALVTATSMLDSLVWVGTIASETQTLAFPRNGEYFDTFLGYTVTLSSSVVPKRIIVATYELAYHLLNNDGLLDDTGDIDSISIGGISISRPRNPNKFPSRVAREIQPLLASGGAVGSPRSWWRAN